MDAVSCALNIVSLLVGPGSRPAELRGLCTKHARNPFFFCNNKHQNYSTVVAVVAGDEARLR